MGRRRFTIFRGEENRERSTNRRVRWSGWRWKSILRLDERPGKDRDVGVETVTESRNET